MIRIHNAGALCELGNNGNGQNRKPSGNGGGHTEQSRTARRNYLIAEGAHPLRLR